MSPNGFPPRLFVRDAVAFCLLLVVAQTVGFLVNLTREHPLPLIYISRENRLERAVHLASPASGARPATAQPQSGKPRQVGLEEFQRFAAEGHGPVLDARSEAFYRLGHVPGAVNLSREAFEKDYAALRPMLAARKGQPIAVYCSGADCQDSEMVAEALLKLGFGEVLVYPEGWEQWTEAGLPQDPPAKGDK